MRLIVETGFTVKLGQEAAYQTWLAENEEKIAAVQPAGAKYLGTFAVMFSSEKEAGPYRSLIELDSYATLDAYAALFKDETSELGSLTVEESQFIDYSPNAPWSNQLYKLVADTFIWDVPSDAGMNEDPL